MEDKYQEGFEKGLKLASELLRHKAEFYDGMGFLLLERTLRLLSKEVELLKDSK